MFGAHTLMKINKPTIGNPKHYFMKWLMGRSHFALKWPQYAKSCESECLPICSSASANLIHSYSIPRGAKPDIKKLYTFAAKARDELAVWVSGLSESVSVDMMDLGRIHLPHVLQLQYVLKHHLIS